MNCQAELELCGYTTRTARRTATKLVREGVVKPGLLSPQEMAGALRALCAKHPRSQRENLLYERSKMMVGDLESSESTTCLVDDQSSAPAQAASPDESEDAELTNAACSPGPTAALPEGASPDPSGLQVLAELSDASVSHIRKTDEAPPRVSILDSIGLLAGVQQAKRTWCLLRRAHPEVDAVTASFRFPGRGRETPVTNAQGIVFILMHLPGRATALLRAKAAELVVRYLGGDPTLIPEIQAQHERQQRLAREDPEHPVRLFGEAVESRVPAPPIQHHRAPELKGAAHHYALRSEAYPGLWKTGSSKDPFARLESEERKHQGRLRLSLFAIWFNEGPLEFFARRHLKEMPPADWAVQGTEYRITTAEDIERAMDLARAQHVCQAQPDEDEREWKRRRTDLELKREELELDRGRLELDRGRMLLEKGIVEDTARLELQEKQLGLERRRHEFECASRHV
jgi:hypothetical protein